MSRSLNTPHLILLGGGHCHALFLKQWIHQPIPDVKLTLVSDGCLSPYSGMLPGVIAGHYTVNDNHIDLRKLCEFAGAEFIDDVVTGFDPQKKRVILHGQYPVAFDFASINTGATPNLSIKGVREYAISVKPISQFIPQWNQFLAQIVQSDGDFHVGVVGSGAGGVEIILAMEHAVSQLTDLKAKVYFHLVTRGDEILTGYTNKVRRTVIKHLAQRSIAVHYRFDVTEVTGNQIIASDGQRLDADRLFWCTSAAAPAWPKDSGFATDERGFISVEPTLQTQTSPDIFAVGDIAHMVHAPRPKAGVYAVRQAPILFHNIRALLQDKPLQAYHPQDDFLSLLALGDKTAVGMRKPLTFSGRWVWRWKDKIDQRFMNQFK